MGGGSGGGGDQETTLRYADYVEAHHETFLDLIANKREELTDSSPFSTYSFISPDDAFFGAGVVITSFNSLFENYELYLQDFDIDASYDSLFSKTVDSQNVKDLVNAEGALLSDDLETDGIPRMKIGARDVNSVNSSTYVIAAELLEAKRIKALSKFSTTLKISLLPLAVDRWKTTLAWNQSIVSVHSDLMKFYFAITLDTNTQNYDMAVKNSLWPFTLLDYERAALGALQGAMSSETVGGEASSGSKVLGGAAAGAALGSYIMPGWGTLIGGVVGGIAGALS